MSPEAFLEEIEALRINQRITEDGFCYLYDKAVAPCQFTDCPGCDKSKSSFNRILGK